MPKPITPADIANPARKSGYSYVRFVQDKRRSRDAVPYQAATYLPAVKRGPGHGSQDWLGPRRATALEAAQDYCDHVNGNGIAPAVTLKSAGHNGKRDSLPRDPELDAARGYIRDAYAQRMGKQGYVYLIIMMQPGGGHGRIGGNYGKIGYSTNPEARVAELQTGNPHPLRLHAKRPGTEADESALHAKYIKYNVLQEWFWITKELLLEWDVEHLVPSDEGSKVAA